jgi:hypothetical protein
MVSLISRACSVVADLAQDEEMQMMAVFKHGFDVKRWIEQPKTAPSETYLAAYVKHDERHG